MFAHRGARALAPDNTIEAFQLGLRLGATGLESDVWMTSDGIAVLDHDGEVRSGRFKKSPIGQMRRDQLPEHIPTLLELFEACGTEYHLSLDLKDRDAGQEVIDLVWQHCPELMGRVWLCHPVLDHLIALRPINDQVKLVDSTRLERISEGPERRAARLADEGIDGINLRRQDWNGGLVALFHRFERTAFSWDLQLEHQLQSAFRMGIDAVYSDFVDRMVDVFSSEVDTPNN